MRTAKLHTDWQKHLMKLKRVNYCYAFPETKGRLLNTLISAGMTHRDINMFSGGLDERQEAVIIVLRVLITPGNTRK